MTKQSRQSNDSELVDFDGILVAETKIGYDDQGAILVKFDEDREPAWFPKSQVEVERLPNSKVKVTCPEWLATEKRVT